MIDGMKVLGLITARGGSKRIPLKNIKSMAAQPLITYTIEAAKESRYIDEIVVSTEDERIATIAREWGAAVPFKRPEALATDEARSIDVVIHAIAELVKMGKSFDLVVLLQPTSPLRISNDIDGALERYIECGCRSVVSVSTVSESPVLYRTMDATGTLSSLLDVCSTVRKQDMPTYYKVNGAVYVNRCSELDTTTSLNDNPIGYLMPESRAIDIDEIADFEQAEKILCSS